MQHLERSGLCSIYRRSLAPIASTSIAASQPEIHDFQHSASQDRTAETAKDNAIDEQHAYLYDKDTNAFIRQTCTRIEPGKTTESKST